MFIKAKNILYAKYSIPTEFQERKRGIILSHKEADILETALRKAIDLEKLIFYEDEIKKTELEIERLKKINDEFVPPLDDYINEEAERLKYLKERSNIIRRYLFKEATK